MNSLHLLHSPNSGESFFLEIEYLLTCLNTLEESKNLESPSSVQSNP